MVVSITCDGWGRDGRCYHRITPFPSPSPPSSSLTAAAVCPPSTPSRGSASWIAHRRETGAESMP